VAGDQVICTGYDLGMNTPGGFGQYIRVPSTWLVRKPEGLSLMESMQLGTAGFTAALSVLGLQKNEIFPERGQVLVTGATGGVGTIALMLLHKLGYETVAVTGKAAEHAFLASLGVSAILTREELTADNEKILLPARWAGVIDTVGGTMLAAAVKGTGYDGVVTSCGNAASGDLPLNVYPFILRGVHLMGIYSAQCQMSKRQQVWEKLATEWKVPQLSTLCCRIGLGQLDDAIRSMIAGQTKGRLVVDLEDLT
jgi:putative YhdH/YhfP family quinone oxidoreductase